MNCFFLHLKLASLNNVAQVLAVLVQASTLSVADASQLTALMQCKRVENTDGEESPGAPAASVYEGYTGGVVDALNDLIERQAPNWTMHAKLKQLTFIISGD